MPLLGPIFKFILGGSTRHSYKVSTAIEEQHPTLNDMRPKMKEAQRWAAPAAHHFPQRYKGQRGTPEHHPITDFEHALPGNERGSLWDLLFHGRNRGFRVRFKTGVSQTGGQTVFTVRREVPRNFVQACCDQLVGLFREMMNAVCYLCRLCSNQKEVGASDQVEVLDANGQVLGRVRSSLQLGRCESFLRTRFNKKALPLYDILDAQGEILYTLTVPIRQYKFMGFCCAAFEDYDFISILPGPRKEGRFGGLEEPEKFGWILPLETRVMGFMRRCIGSMESCLKVLNVCTFGKAEECATICNVCLACVNCCRTCPMDNITQVPHPGLDHLRCTFPCSHGMSATRMRLPPGGVSPRDRMLLTAAVLQIDMEGSFLTL